MDRLEAVPMPAQVALPRRFELSTSALSAVSAATAVASLALAADYADLYWQPSRSVALPLLVVYSGLLVLLVATQSWWSWSTRRMLRGFGITGRDAIRHWSKKVSLILLVLSACCGMAQSYADPHHAILDRAEFHQVAETSAVSMAIRAAGLALLLYGISAVRAQVRQAVAVAAGI
jgi:hypothetical protein